MELTKDIPLKGTAWATAIEKYSKIFTTRTNYSLFMFSLSIGIMYDQRIEEPEEHGEIEKSVPRNVLQNNDNGRLDFIFQAAILSTRTIDLTEEERLELAFGEDTKFDKRDFLLSFANFGVTKLVELIGGEDIETMENLKNFAVSTVEGRNFEIDGLSDDILIEDDEDLFLE